MFQIKEIFYSNEHYLNITVKSLAVSMPTRHDVKYVNTYLSKEFGNQT